MMARRLNDAPRRAPPRPRCAQPGVDRQVPCCAGAWKSCSGVKGGTMNTHEGGCHCGAVRFRVVVERYEAIECNCSMCRKKALLHLIVPRDRFTLLAGAEQLTTYRFNTGVAQHTFCRTCGIHPFYV